MKNSTQNQSSSSKTQTVSIKITGQVQGVFFRTLAKKEANRLGLSGFVKNEPDGSVQIQAHGELKTLKEFINWCRGGPQYAKVKHVKVDYVNTQPGDTSFTFTIQ